MLTFIYRLSGVERKNIDLTVRGYRMCPAKPFRFVIAPRGSKNVRRFGGPRFFSAPKSARVSLVVAPVGSFYSGNHFTSNIAELV